MNGRFSLLVVCICDGDQGTEVGGEVVVQVAFFCDDVGGGWDAFEFDG